MESVEVAVVGAGVAGAAAAWRLGLRGRESLVFDRFHSGHARGSSHGPTRIFRLAYRDPYYVSMAQRALVLWRELEQASGRALLEITGGIDCGPEADCAPIASALAEVGAPYEWLDRGEAAARFPGLVAPGAALYSPDTGVLAATDALHALRGQGGATVRWEKGIERLEPEDDSVILRGEELSVRARRAIVCAGAWARDLLMTAGVSLPLRVTREQVFYFAGGEGFPVVIEYGGMARYSVPPMGGAPGLKAGEHGSGRVTQAEEPAGEIDDDGRRRVSEWVSSRFPAISPTPVSEETCLYTLTPDEDFVIDEFGPVIAVSACSGHGFKFAPLVGEIAAALATGTTPPMDPSKFSARRFLASRHGEPSPRR